MNAESQTVNRSPWLLCFQLWKAVANINCVITDILQYILFCIQQTSWGLSKYSFFVKLSIWLIIFKRFSCHFISGHPKVVVYCVWTWFIKNTARIIRNKLWILSLSYSLWAIYPISYDSICLCSEAMLLFKPCVKLTLCSYTHTQATFSSHKRVNTPSLIHWDWRWCRGSHALVSGE